MLLDGELYGWAEPSLHQSKLREYDRDLKRMEVQQGAA